MIYLIKFKLILINMLTVLRRLNAQRKFHQSHTKYKKVPR